MYPRIPSASTRHALIVVLLVGIGGCGPDGAAPTGGQAPSVTAESGPSTPPARGAPPSSGRVALGNAAFREGRLFDPPEDNALDHFVAALDVDRTNAAAREALADLFPLALARIEAEIVAGDRADAERLIAPLERALGDSPALAALRDRLGDRALADQAGLRPPPADRAPATTSAPTTTPLAEAAAAPAPAQPPETPPPAAMAVSQPSMAANDAPADELRTDAAVPTESPTAAPDPRDGQFIANATGLPEPVPVADVPATNRQARLLERVTPDYPAIARQRRLEGWVELEYVVGADGRVIDVRVLDSHPTRVFDAAAERALRRWRFEPGLRDGEPVTSVGRTRIDFNPG